MFNRDEPKKSLKKPARCKNYLYHFIYIKCPEKGNYRDRKQISDYLWWEVGVDIDCK